MNSMQRNIGMFSGGCALFLWIYSLIRFMTYGATGKGSPVLVCFVVFWVAVALTSIIRTSRLYVIVILLLYCAFFFISAQWLFFSHFYNTDGYWEDLSGPFFWMSLLQGASTIGEWLSVMLVFVSLILLWAFGIRFAMKPMSYEGSLRVLEIGALSFFAIGLLQIVFGQAPGANLYLLLFFLWAILSIILNRTIFQGNEENRVARLFRLVLLFTSSMFLMVMTIMTFFTDTLKWLTEMGISATKAVAEPFLPYLISFLRLLFGSRRIRDNTTQGGLNDSSGSLTEALDEPGLFYVIMEKLFVVILVLMLLTIAVTLARIILKLLFSKRGGSAGQKSLRDLLRAGFCAALAFFTYFYKNLKSVVHLWIRDEKAMKNVYKRLVRWGTIRGVYHEAYETPLEYTQKLAGKYTKYEEVFRQIVTYYYRETYGHESLSRDEIAIARKNIRKLFI